MHKTFDVHGPVRIDVQLASGEVDIDPTLDGHVEVELIARSEEAQELVDQARVELRESGGRQELVVDVPHRPKSWNLGSIFGRQNITCLIRCPEGSDLKARTKSADLKARGALGAVEVSTASGDVSLEDVRGDLSLKSASGDLSARSVAGRASANTASGDVSIESVFGPLSANTASGDLDIGSADSDVKANTASGDATIGAAIRGTITINAASGDIHVGVRRGSRVHLDCTTMSGDTRSELELDSTEPEGEGPFLELKARTASGDITITRASAPADTQGVHA